MQREKPSFEDYVFGGALANVSLWIYLLLLNFAGNLLQSDALLLSTIIPVAAMVGGALIASLLFCRRSRRRFPRIGFIIGVAATAVNIFFGVAASDPSTLVITAFCFMTAGVAAAAVWQNRNTSTEIALL